MIDPNPRRRIGRALVPCLVLCTAAGVGAAADDIPRTPSGRPDLSGTYDVATLTPLSRPAQFGDALTLTPDEAKAIADRWATNLAKDLSPKDPDRGAPPKGGVEFYLPEYAGAAGGVGGYNSFFVDLGEGMFKIDGKYRTSIITHPANGRPPPLTEAARKRMAARASAFGPNTGEAWWIDRPQGPYDHPEMRPLGERCILGFGSTSGPPALPVMYNNHKRIVQTDDYVMILAEMNHDARMIRIDGTHAPADIRRWMGDSVGHWEDDTLVVETTNFRAESTFGGATENLRVVERFSRIDADTLLYRFTVEDPDTWAEPWSGEYPWPASNNLVYEYACHEGNYALGGILRGARVLEEEAMAARDGGD